LLLLVSILGTGGIVIVQDAGTLDLGLTVTNTSEEINGDVSCPVSLVTNPSADGISLIEALTAIDASRHPARISQPIYRNSNPSFSRTPLLISTACRYMVFGQVYQLENEQFAEALL